MVRDLWNFVRRCEPPLPLRALVNAVWRPRRRGVAVALVSDDPMSVPSSKISFNAHMAPGRMVLARVGDGIVLNFGGTTTLGWVD